jgi:hypothetical protein
MTVSSTEDFRKERRCNMHGSFTFVSLRLSTHIQYAALKTQTPPLYLLPRFAAITKNQWLAFLAFVNDFLSDERPSTPPPFYA